jgi:hypothetical protein
MKEFCEIEGYCPHSNIKGLGDLANEIGVSLSYISKLYNSCPIGSQRSIKYRMISDYVRERGYNLVNLNPVDNISTRAIRENAELKLENKYLKQENQSLKDLLFKYKCFERIANAIASDSKRLVSPRKKGK